VKSRLTEVLLFIPLIISTCLAYLLSPICYILTGESDRWLNYFFDKLPDR